jgi:hypothetical protein
MRVQIIHNRYDFLSQRKVFVHQLLNITTIREDQNKLFFDLPLLPFIAFPQGFSCVMKGTLYTAGGACYLEKR